MTEEQILKEIEVIFQSVLNQPTLRLNPAHSAEDIEQWDSLNHATLIVKIQDHFEVKFTLFEVLQLKSIGDIVRLVQDKQQP